MSQGRWHADASTQNVLRFFSSQLSFGSKVTVSRFFLCPPSLSQATLLYFPNACTLRDAFSLVTMYLTALCPPSS